MNGIKKHFSKRVFAMFLSIALILSAIPVGAISVAAAADLGTLVGITENGAVNDENSADLSVTYSNTELEWSAKDTSSSRNSDGWWVCARVNAPADFKLEEDFNGVTYQSKSLGGDVVTKEFWEMKNSADTDESHYIDLWVLVNEQYLNDASFNGTDLVYEYAFNWDADDTFEQKVKIIVDPETVSLKKGENTVYPLTAGEDIATIESVTSGAAVSGGNSSMASVALGGLTTLTYSKANSDIYKTEDGWHIGLKVNAPSKLKAVDDFQKSETREVSYQTKVGSAWSDAKSFWTDKNTSNADTEHFVTLWGALTEDKLVSAKNNKENIIYQWRFDWNADGVYEQFVSMSIDPAKVILNAENGEQVFPYLGTVTPLSIGTVKGNTSNLQLIADEGTLYYSEADESVGRFNSGWFMGMKVTAPEGYTEDMLKTSVYRNRATDLSREDNGYWGNYRANDPRKFWLAKDSKDSDTEHFIYMWFSITPENVEKYYNSYASTGVAPATQYDFDWNNDGVFEQTITMKLIPDGSVELEKLEQTGFAFKNLQPDDIWVGDDFQNIAEGGQSSGAITYSIKEGYENIAEVDSNGVLSFKEAGTVVVLATKAGDVLYKEITASYTITSFKNLQDTLRFDHTAIEVAYSSGFYTNTLTGGTGSGEVTYSISDESIATIDPKSGQVTFLKAGEVTVTAVKAGDAHYLDATATYTLKINKSEQAPIQLFDTPASIIYKADTFQNVLEVTGGNGSGKLVYSIIEGEEFASINENGEICTKKAGGVIVVEVKKLGDGGYNDSEPATVSIAIENAEQALFKFENPTPSEITFNDNGNIFVNKAEGGSGNGAITYTLVNGEGVANLDANSGALEILGVGEITVKATKAGDGFYNEATAEYTVTVVHDTPEFSAQDINVIYGTSSAQINIAEILVGSGKYTYEIIGENNIGASVNAIGSLSFADSAEKVGSVTVKITKQEDTQYCERSIEIKVTVSYLDFDGEIGITGDTKNDSGWFTGTVTVTAPEGYLLSNRNELSTDDWKESISIVNDGIYSENIYLKREADGLITDKVAYDAIKEDKEAPSGLKMTYDESLLDKIAKVVTFGVYKADSLKVTFEATDLISGVDYFTYNIGEGDVTVANEDITVGENGVASYVLEIPAQFKNEISVSATDKAGWTTELLKSGMIFVVDTETPKFEGKYSSNENHDEIDGIIYSRDVVTARFEIKETNFELRKSDPDFKVNAEAVALEWAYDDLLDVWFATYVISEEGSYNLALDFADASGNKMESYSKQIEFDKQEPVYSVAYSASPVKDGIFNAPVSATITVDKNSFLPSYVTLSVTAEDIKGDTVKFADTDWTNYAQDKNNWNGNKLTLPEFTADAIYSIELSYENYSAKLAETFTLDTSKSENVTFEYNKNVFEKMIETVTFGFYQANVDVKVTATDVTSGVEHIDLVCEPDKDSKNVDAKKLEFNNIKLTQDENDKSIFIGTESIPADARGNITAKVYDNAKNSTEITDDTVIVVDDDASILNTEYVFVKEHYESENIYYTTGNVTAKFTITEANFDVSDMPSVTLDGTEVDVTWKQNAGTNNWTGEMTVEGEGDHIICVTYKDGSLNEMQTYKQEIHIDATAPVVTVDYPQPVLNGNNYEDNVSAKITVTEHDFDSSKVNLAVEAKTITDDKVDLSSKNYSDYAKDADNWTTKGDVHTLNTDGMLFNIEGIYTLTLTVTDKSGNVSDEYEYEFVVDTTAPKVISIEYSEPIIKKVLESVTFGIYQSSATVTVTATDNASGIEFIDIYCIPDDDAKNATAEKIAFKGAEVIQGASTNENVFTATYTIPPEARGHIKAEAHDNVGKIGLKTDNGLAIVVDKDNPTINEHFTFASGKYNVVDGEYYTNGNVSVQLTVTEANFDLSEAPVVKLDGEEQAVVWKRTKIDNKITNNWVTYLSVKGEGVHELTVTYKDASTNEMDSYKKIFHIDWTAPELKVTYAPEDNKPVNGNNYKNDRTPVIEVTEHYFDSSKVNLTVEAKDITGRAIDLSSKNYSAYAKNADNWTNDGDVYTLHKDGMLFDTEGVYTVTLTVTDMAGNVSKEYKSTFVIDKKAPTVNVEYSKEVNFWEEIAHTITFGYYAYKDEVKVTVTSEDVISGVDYLVFSYTREDGASETNLASFTDTIKAADLTFSKDGKTATYSRVIPSYARGYISVNVADRAGNIGTKSDSDRINVVDNTAPEKIDVDYNYEIVRDADTKEVVESYEDGDNVILYGRESMTATFKVKEVNFYAEDVNITVNGEKVSPTDWSNDGDIWTGSITITGDGDYEIKMSYKDRSKNEMIPYTSQKIVLDKTAPQNVTIESKVQVSEKIIGIVTFGFYKAKAEITVTADEETSGVDYVELTYTPDSGKNNSNRKTFTEKIKFTQKDGKCTATYEIPASARGTVSVDVVDMLGNKGSVDTGKRLVIDNTQPTIEAEYSFEKEYNETDGIYYTQGKTDIKFTITEANFDIADKPVVTVNGDVQSVEWTQNESSDDWVAGLSLEGNGDYRVNVTFKDGSLNQMVDYKKEIHIDDAKPIIDVTYDNNDAKYDNVYKADRTATVKVTEHNFDSSKVELAVEAKDITGRAIDLSSKNYSAYAKDIKNWTNDGDVYTLNEDGMLFDIEGVYTVTLTVTDIAGNVSDIYSTEFTIDKTAPTVNVEYSEEVNFWEEIAHAITFGYYAYKDEVKVTVTSEDVISGVDYLVFSYTREDGASETNLASFTETIKAADLTFSEDGKTATYSRVIPSYARGYISVDVADRAGNIGTKSDSDRINVVDNVAPEKIKVKYNPVRVLDANTMKDVESYEDGDNVILYGTESMTAVFEIKEVNFYAEDVNITVNGEKVSPTDWSNDGDIWTGSITITGDGDYEIKMSYKDRSKNEMIPYTSPKIALDTKAPVINVEYDNNDARNENCYKESRKAKITITEHNFKADDETLKATITARDIQGNPVTITNSVNLNDPTVWNSNGDVHTAEIPYTIDAIYTFDIEYSDIVGNKAEDFEEQEFVIDHTAPESINIKYSESIIEMIIDTITFGFYNEKVTVTVTADDATSGVDYFDWKYTKDSSSSDINDADKSGTIKSKDDIVYSNKNKTATATFDIPASARGHISVSVTDRAGNSAGKSDDKRINVVDNVSPEVKIEYHPVNTDAKVQFTDDQLIPKDTFEQATKAYYNGDVTATITINEANFFDGEQTQGEAIHNVGILVTKTDNNGNVTKTEYLPEGAKKMYSEATAVEYIKWQTTGDNHSFSISYDEDADYVLDVKYTDLSANDSNIAANDGINATKTYTSKVVTVDKLAPIISVEYTNTDVINTVKERNSNIDRSYFNKKQTAIITVDEHNFRADDFVAEITAKDITGKNIPVEDFAATLKNRNNWRRNGNLNVIEIEYTVDANYTFDCSYTDLAKNESKDYTADYFTVDKTPTENLTVVYENSILDKVLDTVTFGYYSERVKVTISAQDTVSGVYYFVYSYIKSEGVSNVNAQLLNDKINEANNNITHNGYKSTASFTIPKEMLRGTNQFNGTVRFTAVDRSENSTEKVDNKRIVVDNIKPTATISYSPYVQKVNNISYYAGDIQAQININEANFYSEDMKVTVMKDGVRYPVNVKWTDDSADSHTGRFTLTQDGDYTVNINYADRSSNEMNEYTSNQLTLDTKAPTVAVSDIKMNSANKAEKYGFTITANDLNMDQSSFKPVLTAVVRNDDGSYSRKTISMGSVKTVKAGETYAFTIDNLKDDAVYALTCTLRDMSGNTYSKLVLSDGKEYNNVNFSVNRNGSTFDVDKNTDVLVNQYYVYSVESDVVLKEINVDPIETYVVKLNGKVLKEGVDYTTTLSNNPNEWSVRTYKLSKSLFKNEGEYSVIVESVDKTQTTAYSDVKNLNVSFVVDQTAPTVTISGLTTGGRYQVEEQTVTVIPTDDGGKLNSLKVVVLDSHSKAITDVNGKDISVRFDMSGEEFTKYLDENNGAVTFTIPEGIECKVKIICNDCAVNTSAQTNEYTETFDRVTVSPSGWIMFYADKSAFYGSIAGVVALCGAIIFIIIYKKRKDEEEE